jgi:hypothetical protein
VAGGAGVGGIAHESNGGSVGHALNNWAALVRYTEAGFLAIDNNVAQHEMNWE